MSFTLDQIKADAAAKIAAIKNINVSAVAFEKDCPNTNEEADPATKIAYHKFLFTALLATGMNRVEVGLYREKAADTWDYASGVSITDQIVTPPETAIEKYASEWAATMGAFHVEILDINSWNKTCKVRSYKGAAPITAKLYVIYRDGGVTKAAEVTA